MYKKLFGIATLVCVSTINPLWAMEKEIDWNNFDRENEDIPGIWVSERTLNLCRQFIADLTKENPEEAENIKKYSNKILQQIGSQTLDLSGLKIKSLPESIVILENLKYINLEGTSLNTLPNSIANLLKLEFINLKGTPLGDKTRITKWDKSDIQKYLPSQHGATAALILKEDATLPPEIQQEILTKMADKTLQLKQLSEEQLHQLTENFLNDLIELNPDAAESIKANKEIIFEDITKRGWFQIDARTIKIKVLPESIGNLTNLTLIDLTRSQLEALPESIGNLRNLVALHLVSNQLKGLPNSIGNLKSLERLTLTANPLKSLPESILKLIGLNELWLFSTSFEPFVPDFSFHEKERENLRKYFQYLNNAKVRAASEQMLEQNTPLPKEVQDEILRKMDEKSAEDLKK